MIQRVQTLYLLGAFGIMLAMLFLPLATFLGIDNQEYFFTVWGIKNNLGETTEKLICFPILAVLSTALPLFTVFLYRKRWVQIRMCVFEVILLIGMIAFTAYYLFIAEAESMAFKIAGIFPIVALILVYLAFRGIARDEALIKSLDRIR